MRAKKPWVLCLSIVVLAASPILAQVSTSAFVNFEGAQTSPIRISADGTRLFAVNTPNGTLSVFSLSNPASPSLIAEIPVGIEPVSVNINPGVAGNDEAWVVNQISNSVSVISVMKGIVTDTLYAKAEPADVVFAGSGLAFVSVARSNMVNVYNASTHALVKSISADRRRASRAGRKCGQLHGLCGVCLIRQPYHPRSAYGGAAATTADQSILAASAASRTDCGCLRCYI